MLKTTSAFVLVASLISAAPTALDKPATVPLSRTEPKAPASREEQLYRTSAYLNTKWPQLLYPEARAEFKAAKAKRDGATAE